MMTNIFHKLPESVLRFFQPKDKTSLTIHAYRCDDGEWYFNRFPITYKECLCFPDVLNELSGGKSRIKLTVSSEPIQDAERVEFLMDDPYYPEASEYVWKHHRIWLCPWLQWFFGYKPADLWFQVGN